MMINVTFGVTLLSLILGSGLFSLIFVKGLEAIHFQKRNAVATLCSLSCIFLVCMTLFLPPIDIYLTVNASTTSDDLAFIRYLYRVLMACLLLYSFVLVPFCYFYSHESTSSSHSSSSMIHVPATPSLWKAIQSTGLFLCLFAILVIMAILVVHYESTEKSSNDLLLIFHFIIGIISTLGLILWVGYCAVGMAKGPIQLLFNGSWFSLPLGVVTGFISLLLFVSMFMSCLDRALHSSFHEGFVIHDNSSSVPNPIDLLLVSCSQWFPLDYMVFTTITFYMLMSSVYTLFQTRQGRLTRKRKSPQTTGCGAWLGCSWLRKISCGSKRPELVLRWRNTRPGSLLLTSLFLIYIALVILFSLVNLIPQYAIFGDQEDTRHVPCSIHQHDVLIEKSQMSLATIDNDHMSCRMTQLAQFYFAGTQMKWLGSVFFFAQILFLWVYIFVVVHTYSMIQFEKHLLLEYQQPFLSSSPLSSSGSSSGSSFNVDPNDEDALLLMMNHNATDKEEGEGEK